MLSRVLTYVQATALLGKIQAGQWADYHERIARLHRREHDFCTDLWCNEMWPSKPALTLASGLRLKQGFGSKVDAARCRLDRGLNEGRHSV